jgi:hypothetical protein
MVIPRIEMIPLIIGDEVIVEYAKLYDEYTPHYINAISITKKEIIILNK